MKSEKKFAAQEFYALAFGLFLGLAIWKFGNPVILDQKISAPASLSEFLNFAWPTHWANWIFFPLAIIGAVIAFAKQSKSPQKTERGRPAREFSHLHHAGEPTALQKWLWLLPLFWFGWQLLSAAKTVDASLTATTLWEFFGCVACYFLGAFLFGTDRALKILLIGILAAFAFCLVRAIDQRLFEFPQSHQMLIAGERAGWTNFPPETLLEMKRENVIITNNGADVANPAILAKFAKGRVNGTLVYPNALAGIVLLLFPISIVLAFNSTKKMKSPIRFAVIALTFFLGGAGFFWSGSKLGWLIAIALGGVCLFRLKWPAQLKWMALIFILLIGMGIFAIRFQHYFANGATSVAARLDYWRAAVQTTSTHPIFGTGPGTFQRPYARLKSPEAEMARLTHNDYLEQFSDSGIAGGIFYAAWIFLSLVVIGKKNWKSKNDLPQSGRPIRSPLKLAAEPSAFRFAIFIGLLGWFAQGFGEFGLYIPALAWIAFTLLGYSFAISAGRDSVKP